MTDNLSNSVPERARMSAEQQGFMVAALVAFFGVAIGGPALARYQQHQQAMQHRVVERARKARRHIHNARKTVRRKLRRLGGGSIWR